MGGVGKTTIMKHIHNDLLKEQRFERVIWVTISKEFNVMKVQDDIAGALKLKKDWPKEGDKLRRAAILSEMLKKAGKHVLILDDVWDEVSLEEVGLPEPSGSNGCKLVLTTRSEHVCKYMGCRVIKVKPLSEQQALTLFLSKVGPNIVQNQTLMPILRLVVKECAGLPLTIVVVAGTLKGEEDPLIWKNAIRELKGRIEKVEGVEAKVIERLKFSFDHLKDEKVKYCFLHCALYPEDYEIKKDELIECWIEEGFIDDMGTREEMKDKGHVILKKLENNCLLENVSSGFVKIHDAVREMTFLITRMNPRYMIQASLQLDELPKKEQWSPDIEKCSQFVLYRDRELPNSISELKNLTTLLLCGCEELRDLPCLSMLQELKKLDLSGTKIEEVPEGMDMLIKLRYLDLDVSTLKEIPAGLLPKLVHLQHLSFDMENEKVSLKLEEMEPLKKLECLTGRLEDISELNKFISSMQQIKKNLMKCNLVVGESNIPSTSDKRLTIGGVHDWEGLEVLELEDLPKLSALIMKDEGIGSPTTSTLASPATFSHLKQITIFRCSSMKTLLPHWLLPNLQNLEEIWVQECHQLVEILGVPILEVEEKGSDALIKFHLPKLRELRLIVLPNLKSICGQSGVMVCNSLQLIYVYSWNELKRIPPFVPLVGNGHPYAYAPPSLTIRSSTEWWESLEWHEHPNFKNVLRFNPFGRMKAVGFRDAINKDFIAQELDNDRKDDQQEEGVAMGR
ncbi:disease resistance protein SUMM2-like [Gossypium hirsutum]|uniref:Disease resistance protein SUMM2-like n=1 Tax=Gossypium hirsutum TaxID=3635 RepID=A0A1U8NJB4_GOSHI|nr:disease resistance protein SUMM2-like [Gossypium hirsutum]